MSKTKFTDQFISEQKQIMDRFEAGLCNHNIPGKENKKQCFIDFDKGRITAAQNYADALDEIKRLNARITELVDIGDNLFNSLNPIVWKHEWLDNWWKLSSCIRRERDK